MAELFEENIITPQTLNEILGGMSSLGGLEVAESTPTATGNVMVNPTIIGGTLDGVSYKSSSSEAKLEIFPSWDKTIGQIVKSASGTTVFKIEIDGTNAGDITIGNYAGNQGILWDQSAGTLTVKGGVAVGYLDIPDTVTEDSFHVDSSGNTWWGSPELATAPAKILNTGEATFTNVTATQYFAWNADVFQLKGIVSLVGTLQLHSFTVATLPTGATSTGAKSPTAIGNDLWTNPTHAYYSDNVYATTNLSGLIQIYKTWGNNIPANSYINGLLVSVEGHTDKDGVELWVQLSWDGGTNWTISKIATLNNGGDTIITFGGPTDNWNRLWTDSECSDANLFVKIQMQDYGAGATAYVDHITLNVYYYDNMENPVAGGSLAYVSDGQKAGETSNGTGNLAFYDVNGNWIAVDTGNQINANIGTKIQSLDSDPTSPSTGQFFFGSVNAKFRGYDGASWKDLAWTDDLADYAKEIASPSDTLQLSNDTETDNIWAGWDAWTEADAITSTVAGKIRVKWDIRKLSANAYPVYSKVYVNDVAVGSANEHNSTSYSTYTEMSVDVNVGDEIEIYVLGDPATSNSNSIRIRNLRLYWDLSTKGYIDAGDDTPKFNDIDYYASDTLRQSNDTDKYTASQSVYAKVKEIKVTAGTLTNCRIKFDLASGGTPNFVKAKIYKNGTAIGTERTSTSSSYATYSEDFTIDFTTNDLIQIYAYTDNPSYPAHVRNFRIYYDYGVTKLDGLALATEIPIATADLPTLTFTNQDP